MSSITCSQSKQALKHVIKMVLSCVNETDPIPALLQNSCILGILDLLMLTKDEIQSELSYVDVKDPSCTSSLRLGEKALLIMIISYIIFKCIDTYKGYMNITMMDYDNYRISSDYNRNDPFHDGTTTSTVKKLP